MTKAQILGFHWKPDKQRDFARFAIEGQLNRALEQRRQIREAPEGTADALLRERLLAADGFINPARRYGDLVVSAFFAADNDRKRKERIELLAADLAAQRSQFDVERHNRLDAVLRNLRNGTHPIRPFHWEIEFPEVFSRENSGFDAFVGNPPFLGGTRITTANGTCYRDWIAACHPEGSSNADLSAHFFRRCFRLLRRQGCLGLIATNTISQGDTRVLGLEAIVHQGGRIYEATKRYSWPGLAAVAVSIVHIQRSDLAPSRCLLDGRIVPQVTAFLYHAGGSATPVALRANAGKTFRGCDVFGIGFVFDDLRRPAGERLPTNLAWAFASCPMMASYKLRSQHLRLTAREGNTHGWNHRALRRLDLFRCQTAYGISTPIVRSRGGYGAVRRQRPSSRTALWLGTRYC